MRKTAIIDLPHSAMAIAAAVGFTVHPDASCAVTGSAVRIGTS